MFNDDSDEDDSYDVIPFVGRDKERETVKELIGHSVRTVQLTGQPMVGKGRLAEEISKELQQEMESKDRKLLCYHMICRDISTMPDLLAHLSACLSMDETAESEKALIQHFQAIVKNEKKCAHLFVFLKCENAHKNSFYVQFVDIVRKLIQVSKKVFVIITTQKSFNISNSREVKVSPLSNSNTVTLVRRYAPNVDIDPYVPAIEQHCYGLPPLAMDAAQELAKASVPYTPEEFTELLSTENRSKRVHCDNDVLNAVAMAQFNGLNEYLKQRIIDVSIFKGSFRVNDALKIWDTSVEAKKNLNEMTSLGVVEYVNGDNRMHLQTVIGHYVRNLMGSHIAYDDTVRLRFVTLFVDVLKKADSELFIKPQQTVFGYLHDDWPNLKQVLEEAIHCTEHTYTTFLKVSVSAENLLVKCFPGEAVKFYEAMMMASTKFGTREECATQKWLLGMAKTIGKGQDLIEAMGLFHDALPVLKEAENREALVSLLADMGLNYNRQGKNAKSRRFYQEALEESGRCTDGRKLTNRVINIRCYLAIPMIFLEYFDQAEDLLKETLEETRKIAPYHPAIPIMINSLGLIYERAGKSDDEALRYYTNSLTERRKYADVAPGDLVVVLNNVAMQHSKRGNHDYALQLLSEAREIRMKIERVNYHTALTCWNIGQVYGRKREYRSALSEITYALATFKQCTSSHFVIVEVYLLAAHFASCLKQYEEAEGFMLEALKLEPKHQELHPTGDHILLILEHLLMTYLSWKKMCSHYLDRAIAEVSRLLEIHRPSSSLERNRKYLQHKQCLYRVRSELDQTVVAGELLKDVLGELLGVCDICRNMKTQEEDMVEVFHSMTTSVCSDLASAEILLRSEALSVAAQILREASRSSNSPPLSPTQEISDPPSYYVGNQRVDQFSYESPAHGVQEIQREQNFEAFCIEGNVQPFPSNSGFKVTTQSCGLQRNSGEHISQGIPQSYLFQGNPREKFINREMCQSDFQTHVKTVVDIPPAPCQYEPATHVSTQIIYQRGFPVVPQLSNPNSPTPRFPNDQIPENTNPQINGKQTAGNISNDTVEDRPVNTPNSFCINVDLLRRPNPQNGSPANIHKQKTVEDVWTVDSQPIQQERCSFDPKLKFPPSHRFPKFEEDQQNEPVLAGRTQRPGEDFEKLFMNPSLDFHEKLATHVSVLEESKSRFASGYNHGTEQTSSSGYDSSTNSHAQKRPCTPNLSTWPTSGGTHEPAEHDDRQLGKDVCCSQPNCTCISKTAIPK